jgi:hypothetical protein
MTFKPFHIIFPLLFVGVCFVNQATAQEEEREVPDPEVVVKDSKDIKEPKSEQLDVEIEATTHIVKPVVTPQKEAEPVKPTKPTKAADKDPLTFNFLYYIIEKFKLSDLIE